MGLNKGMMDFKPMHVCNGTSNMFPGVIDPAFTHIQVIGAGLQTRASLCLQTLAVYQTKHTLHK